MVVTGLLAIKTLPRSLRGLFSSEDVTEGVAGGNQF